MRTLETLQAQYLSHHRALGHSEKTVSHYQESFKLLNRFLTEAGHASSTEALTTATMTAFVAWLRETPTRGWRGATERTEAGLHGICRDPRAFTRYLVDEEILEKAPKAPLPKLSQTLFPVLTKEELARIFATRQLNPATEIGTRNRALIAFMLDTGVRLAEVSGLTLADVDVREGMAKVWGKGRKERHVFFSEAVAAELRRWLAIRGEAEGNPFWLERAGVRMLFERIKAEAGLPQLHPHEVRHTSATNLPRAGADIHSVRRLLGHSSLSVTERYLSLSSDDLKTKHAASSPYERLRAIIALHETKGRRRLRAS
ncbi:MAG: tyrosine-type recombinase/integrase [Thermomicrobiales bacterium]